MRQMARPGKTPSDLISFFQVKLVSKQQGLIKITKLTLELLTISQTTDTDEEYLIWIYLEDHLRLVWEVWKQLHFWKIMPLEILPSKRKQCKQTKVLQKRDMT